MSLLAALAQIYSIEEAITAQNPYNSNDTLTIKKAYPYIPREADGLSSTPCFVNTWTLQPEDRYPGWRELKYDVRMQLAVLDANFDIAAGKATAFMDPILAAFDSHISLGGSVSHHDIRGGDPTLVVFRWNNINYAGLDLHLVMYLKDSPTFSA